MICPGVMQCPLSPRSQEPAHTPHQSQHHSSTSSWINKPTGPLCIGAGGSAVFLATSTQRTYQAAMKRFHSFCTKYNVEDSFPLTERILCFSASYLAEEKLAPQTVRGYLLALRNAQISLGLPDPREQSSLPLLKRIQAGPDCSVDQTPNHHTNLG